MGHGRLPCSIRRDIRVIYFDERIRHSLEYLLITAMATIPPIRGGGEGSLQLNRHLEGLIPSDFSLLAEDQFLQGFRAGESTNPGDVAQGFMGSFRDPLRKSLKVKFAFVPIPGLCLPLSI